MSGAGIVFALAATLGAAADEAATPLDVIPFDRARSHAEFQVRVIWLFSVEGRFGSIDGEVRIDHAARVARVVAKIDAVGVAMNSGTSAAWARSNEFFDAARHPQIRFESEPFPLAVLKDGGDILGHLTIRGETRPVGFALRPSDCPGAAARDCPVVADGSIQRSDFSMRSRRATLSDKVKLHFTIFAEPR